VRTVFLTLMLTLAGCGEQPSSPPEQRKAAPPPITFDGALSSAGGARLAHGERLTRVLGCRGCHTDSLQGQRFYELYASNLTRDVPRYQDSELERLIRAGVRPDGREVWGMSSEVFQHLHDADLRPVMSYLRTLAPGGAPTGTPLPWTAETRRLIAEGTIKPAAQLVSERRQVQPPDFGPQHALGRYITMVTCAECHGPQLRGQQGDTPDLVVASAYSRVEFERLMTTGVPTGGRTLSLMAEVARGRFAYLTRHERDAVYAYLRARAERLQ
jgi:cytochrome c553